MMTIEQSVVRGTITAEHGRRPRTNDSRRVCVSEECNTVLSRYNLGDWCRLHVPPRFPRIRGTAQ